MSLSEKAIFELLFAGATLSDTEIYWRDHSEWLADLGYQLRARFLPGWVPSWLNKPDEIPFLCEDAWSPPNGTVIDAVRINDGSLVVLKRIDRRRHAHEVRIGEFFTSLGPSKENHCVPILDKLQDPDDDQTTIIVMPYLRRYNSPKFDTFGEAVEFFRQIFEGVQFMHRHNVAHRDCHSLNIMMDGAHLYPHGFHPDINHQWNKADGKLSLFAASHTTRTWKPVKYYLVDFGISRGYSPAQRNGQPLWDRVIIGGDKTAPEHQDGYPDPFPRSIYTWADPFPTDIYYLGNFILREFIEGFGPTYHGFHGFDFMKPLVRDMTAYYPAQRPTIDEVVDRFAEIQAGLSSWKLRSRIVDKKEGRWIKFPRVAIHWARRTRSFLARKPSIPVPAK
uniref:Protein kinase domain-containing protein n=1 Tax=Mycena chlorophos TaxID=658473 RepID=A0ABQ0LI57_MYCCL|nr:predicted protein [Mycena chlorophos]